MYELIVESIQFLQLENLIYTFFSPKLFPATQRGRLNNQAYSGFVLKRHVQNKIKTGWTVDETGKDRLRNFSVVESRSRGNLLISTLFETKPRPTSCTDASRNQSPCTSLTLPKRYLNVLSRQSTSLSRSLVESEQKRQEITKSVMEQSIAEFAKGIQ